MNLFDDWNDHLSTILELNEPDKKSAHYYYFQEIEREIIEKPRRLHVPDGFHCPPELSEGFALLKTYIESGKNLKPFLSKGIDRLKSIDPLFAQWNVRHFHLGDKIENGFIRRTGPLAFAKIASDDVYILWIGSHGDWSSKNIIQSAHDNWPFLLEDNLLEGITNINASGSQSEIDQSRANMTSTYVKVDDGTQYIFGDMTISGHNFSVMSASCHMMRVFAMIEADIKKQLAIEAVYSASQPKLSFQEGKYIVECTQTGFSSDITDTLTQQLSRVIEPIRRREA